MSGECVCVLTRAGGVVWREQAVRAHAARAAREQAQRRARPAPAAVPRLLARAVRHARLHARARQRQRLRRARPHLRANAQCSSTLRLCRTHDAHGLRNPLPTH